MQDHSLFLVLRPVCNEEQKIQNPKLLEAFPQNKVIKPLLQMGENNLPVKN